AYVVLILVASIIFVTPIRSEESDHFTLVNAYWGTDRPIEVSPGDVATLTVIIRYESIWDFSNLKACLSLPKGFKAVGGLNEVIVQYTGAISAGSLVKLEFPVFITPDVDKGNYTADLELEYYVTETFIPEQVLKIAFEVVGKPSIEIKALDNRLCEGNQQISVTLSNEGDADAYNLEIVKVQTSAASAELEGAAVLGRLEPGENVAVPLRIYVPTGMKGKIVSLTIEASCVGPRSVPYLFSETLQIPVKPSTGIPPLALKVEPKELIIGKSSKTYLELMNTGNHILSDVKLTLSPDNILKIFGPTILQIDRLDPEESLQVEVEIYVPSTTTAPTASVTVTATYLDEDLWITQSESHKLNVLLRGLIDISLTDVAVIPSTPRVGGPFSITITVTNVGTSTAYAAYAIPSLEDLPLKTFGPKSVYIGNIEINLPTTFTVNLQLENTTQKTITVPVTLRYMDNLRSLHNVTFSVPISVAPRTSSAPLMPSRGEYFPGGNLIIIGVAAAAVVSAVLIVVKKRR
ncbi:MAG: hypothetical protein ACE5KU_06105, partial [Nitrososphaerales archaeon]